MALMTRQQDVDILNHLLYTVADFDNDANEPICLALTQQGISDFSTLVQFPDSDYAYLEYLDGNNDQKTVPRGKSRRLELLVRYAQKLIIGNNNVNLTHADWMAVRRDLFLNYMISNPPLNPNHVPRQHQGSSADVEAITNFRKTIKRDPERFPTLKDIRHFDTWNRHTLAVASAQDLDDKFDPNFQPSNNDQVTLFKLKQN